MEPLHRSLGLTDEEYQQVTAQLGREPNRNRLSKMNVVTKQ